MPRIRDMIDAIPGFWPACPQCAAVCAYPAFHVRTVDGCTRVVLECRCGHRWQVAP